MPRLGHPYPNVIAALLFASGVTLANAGRRSPETDLAAPGAALYEFALNESLKSLMSKQEQEEIGARNRPPSPGPDYFWCDNCKTYHKNEQTPAAAPQPSIAQNPNVAPQQAAPQISVPQQPDAAAARPPSPSEDSYWCENCKSYHKKQSVPNPPGGAAQAAPGGEESYYCEDCKTYHRRQPAAQQPGAPPAVSPAEGGVPPQASDDYYYCENCKTYHRHQSSLQLPAGADIISGLTNNLYQNPFPLINPQGTKR
jgi:hypothetical protein